MFDAQPRTLFWHETVEHAALPQPPAVLHVPVHVPAGKPLTAQSKHGLLHVVVQHFFAAPPQCALAQSPSAAHVMPLAVLQEPAAHTRFVPHTELSALQISAIVSPVVAL